MLTTIMAHLDPPQPTPVQDWNDGRIPYYTTPPTRGNTEFDAAEVVGGWSKEFDAEAVFAAERSAVIAHLPSSEDRGAVFFEATSAGVCMHTAWAQLVLVQFRGSGGWGQC